MQIKRLQKPRSVCDCVTSRMFEIFVFSSSTTTSYPPTRAAPAWTWSGRGSRGSDQRTRSTTLRRTGLFQMSRILHFYSIKKVITIPSQFYKNLKSIFYANLHMLIWKINHKVILNSKIFFEKHQEVTKILGILF